MKILYAELMRECCSASYRNATRTPEEIVTNQILLNSLKGLRSQRFYVGTTSYEWVRDHADFLIERGFAIKGITEFSKNSALIVGW